MFTMILGLVALAVVVRAIAGAMAAADEKQVDEKIAKMPKAKYSRYKW